jgi:hypothetical protein
MKWEALLEGWPPYFSLSEFWLDKKGWHFDENGLMRGGLLYFIQFFILLSPLTLWVRIQLRRGVLDTTLCDKLCQWLAVGRWFSQGTPVSSTNLKTELHNIAEILLKVVLILNLWIWPPACLIQRRVHLAWAGFELIMLVVISTDCIGSYKSNYHTIMVCTVVPL